MILDQTKVSLLVVELGVLDVVLVTAVVFQDLLLLLYSFLPDI